MRIVGILYVVIVLTLNFFVEEEWFILLALTTYPVSLVLLLRRPKVKPQTPHRRNIEVEEAKHSI